MNDKIDPAILAVAHFYALHEGNDTTLADCDAAYAVALATTPTTAAGVAALAELTRQIEWNKVGPALMAMLATIRNGAMAIQ